jgi:hypothetical protein
MKYAIPNAHTRVSLNPLSEISHELGEGEEREEMLLKLSDLVGGAPWA